MFKKSFTRDLKTTNLTASFQKREDNGFSRPSDIGVSAPFGIALFLCPSFMVGVFWETSVCRLLCPGLLTRNTPAAQCLVALRGGLQFDRGSHMNTLFNTLVASNISLRHKLTVLSLQSRYISLKKRVRIALLLPVYRLVGGVA